MKYFFCYHCGTHEWLTFCACCGERACERCLMWQYECRQPGDAFCKAFHLALVHQDSNQTAEKPPRYSK